MAIMKGGNGAIKSLGAMVGLLIALYVFDQIISIVMPIAANCALGSSDYNTSQTDLCTGEVAAGGGNFTTSLTFIKNLFGVIGIIGTFEIIYKGLRRSGLI